MHMHSIGQTTSVLVNAKDTSDQHRGDWSSDPYDARLVRPFCLDIWRVERYVFVARLPGLGLIPVHPQWSCFLQYARASICRSHVFGRCFLFLNLFSVKCLVSSLSGFSLYIPSASPVIRILWTGISYVFNQRLYLSLSGMSHYGYFVTVLKLLFAIISSTFVYRHQSCI